MKSDNIVINSLKESFTIINKNKKFIFILFILQLIFFSLFFYVNVTYQSKVLESIQSIIEYMDKLNFDDATIGLNILQQKTPLGPDPLLISRNYKNILYNLQFLLGYSLIVFVLLNGFIWFLCCRLVNKKKLQMKSLIKDFSPYLLKFGLITIIFSILIFLFSFFTVKSYFNPLISQKFIPALIASLILYYFMYISFSILYKTKLKNLHKELFRIGIKKAHFVLLTYFIIILIMSLFLISVFYLLEKNLFLLSISMILMMLAIIWARIFLIKVVEMSEIA